MQLSNTLLRVVFGFTAFALFCLLTGCFQHYYKTAQPAPSSTEQYISTPQYQNRYFILHNGSEVYHMSNVTISEDKKLITCQLDTLEESHLLYLNRGRDGNMQYKANKPEAVVLNEVHLYIPVDTIDKSQLAYTLPIDKIKKVEVVQKNKGRTIGSYVLGVVGITTVIGVCFGIGAGIALEGL